MRLLFAVVLFLLGVGAGFLLTRSSPPPNEVERNARFERDMAGVVLTGQSTRLNREGVFGPERFVIEGVTHVSGDMWMFRSRLSHKDKEVAMPIPIKVMWAGDTPVITLTDLSIPGIGTYTARIVLFRDQYAGTWSGEKGGGQMFGRIERPHPAR